MPLPNFILAGPPKTGTTSIFEWLSQHPDVVPPNVKETYYFYDQGSSKSPYSNFKADGWQGYERFFESWNGEKVIFEASPGHIFSELAAEKLGSIKDLKVAVIHRKAADRLFSEFQFNRYKTKKFTGTFEEYVGYTHATFDHQLLEESMMIPHLDRWLQYVERDRFKIIRFVDLVKKPQMVMERLSNFLEIDPTFFSTFDFVKKNETFGLKNRKLHLLALALKKRTPAFLEKLLVPVYYHFNKQAIPAITSEEQTIKEALEKTLIKAEKRLEDEYADLFLN